MANLKPLLLPRFSIYITVKSISLITCFWLSISSYSLAQEVKQEFDPAMITVTFTKGATIEDIDDTMGKQEPHTGANGSPLKGEFDFEILVPHYSQRIYDDAELLDYEATIAVTLNTGWKLISGLPNEPLKYKLPKMTEKDTIQAPLKKEGLAVLIFEEIITESNSNSNHTNEPPKVVCVHINFQTPTILLSIHKPDKFKEDKDLAYRPEAERDDTNETFGTAYAGIMLRNEDNDDDDPYPVPLDSAPLPRDNDDDKPSDKDDDLVGLKIQTRQPKDFAFKDELMLKLKFDHNDNQIRVYDGKSKSGATKVSLEILDTGVPLNKEASSNEHLNTAVKKEEETLYIEGLGSSESPEAERYGDKPLKVTLCIEPGTTNKKYSESIGLLMHLEIVPDYNRDGKIDGKDRGRVNKINPWIWWINDDDDKTVDERGEALDDLHKLNGDKRDCNDLRVDGVRDFIDFFPLHLDLKVVLESFPSSEYKYILKNEANAFKFFEHSKAVIDGSDEFKTIDLFIKNASVAKENRDKKLSLISQDGVELSEDYLNEAKSGNGVILLEGCDFIYAGGPWLCLEIKRKSDSSKIVEIEFPIKVTSVEFMYRKINLRSYSIYPDTSSSYVETDVQEPVYSYPDKLTNGKYVAYVHGYNTSESQGRGSQANIFKMLHHSGNKARFIGIFWHGDPDTPTGTKLPAPDYHRAVYNGLITSMLLNQQLSFTQGSELTILAHSLGNVVVSNAIANHGLKVNQYYMINGAMPIEAYDDSQTSNSSNHDDMKRYMTEDDWKPYYDHGIGLNKGKQQRLLAANWHTLFKNTPLDKRNNLTWKNLFKKPELLGVAYNFYSPSDHVVENADASEEFGDWDNLWDAATDAGRHAWVAQEIGKGGQNLLAVPSFHDNNGGWKFSSNYTKLTVVPGIPPRLRSRIYTPDEASRLISNAQLKKKPFHLSFLYPDIYDPNRGSRTAGVVSNRYHLLATGIPAMSYAIAVNELDILKPPRLPSKNFNMPASFKAPNTAWPVSNLQQDSDDWLHGDFIDVSYQYLYPLYFKMIEIGKLNEK